MKVFDKTWKLAVAGALVGVLAALLAYFGNPANMAICIACFVRDTAGALKLHSAAPVQYFRPEIVGFAVGAFAISLVTNEYRATAGSSPMIRFVLGAIMVIGALVFLGCPLRMVLRMAAGDLNAYVALVGFAGGIATGSFFLKKGFSLGRAYETQKSSGYVLPVLLLALCIIGAVTGVYAASTEGPGSKHAPVLISLVAALLIGALAQKSRMCFAGSIRDVILMKNFDLLSIIGALFAVMLIFNLATGNFHLSFSGQPIAHSQHLWNILGMYAVGFAAVLAGRSAVFDFFVKFVLCLDGLFLDFQQSLALLCLSSFHSFIDDCSRTIFCTSDFLIRDFLEMCIGCYVSKQNRNYSSYYHRDDNMHHRSTSLFSFHCTYNNLYLVLCHKLQLLNFILFCAFCQANNTYHPVKL